MKIEKEAKKFSFLFVKSKIKFHDYNIIYIFHGKYSEYILTRFGKEYFLFFLSILKNW